MQSCAIDLRQRLFRCSHRKKIVSETREKQSQKYLVSESRGAPACFGIKIPQRVGSRIDGPLTATTSQN